MRDRCALLTKVGHRIPNGVEQNEHRSNVVSVRNGEKLVHAIQEPNRVLLP